MNKIYTVAVKVIATNEILKTIGESSSKRTLERVENGVNINLNHLEYYTEIIEKTEEKL